MSGWSVRVVVAVGVVGVGVGTAAAQPPLPGGPAAVPRPAFSPYLNLAGGFGAPAFNYFGIVRPQIQARQALLGLTTGVMQNQQAIANLQNSGPGAEPNGIPGTGHPTNFLNYGGYFLNNSGTTGGGATGGAGGGRPAAGGLTAGGGQQMPTGIRATPPGKGRRR